MAQQQYWFQRPGVARGRYTHLCLALSSRVPGSQNGLASLPFPWNVVAQLPNATALTRPLWPCTVVTPETLSSYSDCSQ